MALDEVLETLRGLNISSLDNALQSGILAGSQIDSSPTVSLTGILQGKSEQSILIFVGEVGYEVPIDAIVEIKVSESQPAVVESNAVLATITLSALSQLLIHRRILASSVGDQLGLVPFAIKQASEAKRYSIPSDSYLTAEKARAERLGLSDIFSKSVELFDSGSTTSYSTTYTSSVGTPFATSTPGDQIADSTNDSVSDSYTDSKVDDVEA